MSPGERSDVARIEEEGVCEDDGSKERRGRAEGATAAVAVARAVKVVKMVMVWFDMVWFRFGIRLRVSGTSRPSRSRLQGGKGRGLAPQAWTIRPPKVSGHINYVRGYTASIYYGELQTSLVSDPLPRDSFSHLIVALCFCNFHSRSFSYLNGVSSWRSACGAVGAFLSCSNDRSATKNTSSA